MIRHQNVHATGLVLDGTGLILRGPSGAGKSLLTLELIDQWQARGLVAKLVADDRIDIAAEAATKGTAKGATKGASLVMYAPKAIQGLVELRGRGIVKRPFVAKARIDLVVDLVDHLERMVEEDALVTELFGVSLPRCPVPKNGLVDFAHQMLLIREALRSIRPRARAPRQKTT